MSTFTVEIPGKHYVNQAMKINVTNDVVWIVCSFWWDVMKMVLYVCDLPPSSKPISPSYTRENTRECWFFSFDKYTLVIQGEMEDWSAYGHPLYFLCKFSTFKIILRWKVYSNLHIFLYLDC